MFDKILIANRGEIACRIIESAKRMGIKTVAVYSEADRNALHVHRADEAVLIGAAPAVDSYLKIDSIVAACQISGANAVHPGYGFLSEDTELGERLAEFDIKFIGPGTQAIRIMGDKIASKKLARKAGVSVIPGYDDVIQNQDHAVELASKIGYPIMLKPSSAGGGKGMRLAYNDEECRNGFLRSTSEAKSHFGDERVFIEKYIENPRHIEIQILADNHGNVIHLGERECSLQRRYQKVIEEAPSPFLDDLTRVEIANQAVTLAKAVDYVSAGTVEFVVDDKQNYYFLEMNTRLQVEHPVTEFVTGIDLVESMIRIADNEALAVNQEDIDIQGWAIEARIYAEDPSRNFLPSTGRLIRHRPPTQTESVRVDTGVFEGGEVSQYYDPMIAKLIVRQETREEALALMAQSLDAYQISGITSNLPFLQALVRNYSVQIGETTTQFIEANYPEGYDCERADGDSETAAMIACIAHYENELRSASLGEQINQRNWTAVTDWCVITGKQHFEFSIEKIAIGHELTWADGNVYSIKHQWQPGDWLFSFELDGYAHNVQITPIKTSYQIDYFGHRAVFKVLTPKAASYQEHMLLKETISRSTHLKTPMPGLLIELRVEQGDHVKKGDVVAVIEAMKMENTLHCDRDGVIANILATAGESLAVDQPILEFEN